MDIFEASGKTLERRTHSALVPTFSASAARGPGETPTFGAQKGTNQDTGKQRKVLVITPEGEKNQSNPADIGRNSGDVSEPASSLSSGRSQRGHGARPGSSSDHRGSGMFT